MNVTGSFCKQGCAVCGCSTAQDHEQSPANIGDLMLEQSVLSMEENIRNLTLAESSPITPDSSS